MRICPPLDGAIDARYDGCPSERGRAHRTNAPRSHVRRPRPSVRHCISRRRRPRVSRSRSRSGVLAAGRVTPGPRNRAGGRRPRTSSEADGRTDAEQERAAPQRSVVGLCGFRALSACSSVRAAVFPRVERTTFLYDQSRAYNFRLVFLKVLTCLTYPRLTK